MANIQQLLNEEIRRLARKEVISVEKSLKAQLVELRKIVASQNRQIKALEKALLQKQVVTEKTTDDPAEPAVKEVRVTPERIIKWRTQMGLKQAQYARLLGVSPLSVSHWERGVATPRAAQKQRIAQLRDMGKRELIKLCKVKNIKLRPKFTTSEE